MAESTPGSRGSSRAGQRRTSQSRRRSRRSRSATARRATGTRSASARRATASRSSSDGSAPSNGSGVIGSVTHTIGAAATKARGPLIAGGAAAAAAIGGVVVGARVLRPRKKVLGIPIPRDGISLKPLAKEVRKAGKQIGRIADEVGKARAQAEKFGRVLS